MGEVEEQVAKLSDTEIILEFRNALVTLYPILQKLACLENDEQPYDDFDSVAENLWEVLVARSLMWKYGLDNIPKIQRYGFRETKEKLNGYIEVVSNLSGKKWRFTEFIGDRNFGTEVFNVVLGLNAKGEIKVCGLWSNLSFSYVCS
jgi:hypothetical protein